MTDAETAPLPTRPVPIGRDHLSKGLWSTKDRIRFGQCDPAGIVYTPRFFEIFNVVIEEWYAQSLNLDYYHLIGPRRIGLGYANANADFFAPCRMGDTLEIVPRIERVGGSSFSLLLHAFKDEGEALRGRFLVVTTDLKSHKPMHLPDDLKSALLAYDAKGRG